MIMIKKEVMLFKNNYIYVIFYTMWDTVNSACLIKLPLSACANQSLKKRKARFDGLNICGSLPVFGVRVSVTFHLCVHIIFSSVWVSDGPPFGKELLPRLTIFSLFVILVISRFGSEGWIWDLIASVPGLCILFTLNIGFMLLWTLT